MTGSPAPVFSVVVPARNCATVLAQSLGALRASEVRCGAWELIVVDDSSGDDTAEIATHFADTVVRLEGGPRGPAFARNRGAEVARGDCLVFVDSDVRVHTDTLERLVGMLGADRGPAAVFGAYDTSPEAPGIVSQYRNLLHHYVHWQNAGAARTFWAGCGAVRRSEFLAAGMFDEHRFPTPQIEDIELGYRITENGRSIEIAPDIQGTHLKRWTLRNVITTDFSARAVPWMRLVLEHRVPGGPGNLNVTHSEQALTALTGLALLFAVIAGVAMQWQFALVSLACLAVVGVANFSLFRWFARQRGVLFAAATVPLRLMFYVVAGAGAGWAVVLHVMDGRRRHVSLRRQRHEPQVG